MKAWYAGVKKIRMYMPNYRTDALRCVSHNVNVLYFRKPRAHTTVVNVSVNGEKKQEDNQQACSTASDSIVNVYEQRSTYGASAGRTATHESEAKK